MPIAFIQIFRYLGKHVGDHFAKVTIQKQIVTARQNVYNGHIKFQVNVFDCLKVQKMHIELIYLISNAKKKSNCKSSLNPVEKPNKPKLPYCKSAELICKTYRFGMTPRINWKRRKKRKFSLLHMAKQWSDCSWWVRRCWYVFKEIDCWCQIFCFKMIPSPSVSSTTISGDCAVWKRSFLIQIRSIWFDQISNNTIELTL